MKLLPISLSLFALVISAGCAMDGSGTRAMGATSGSSSTEARLYCKDGQYTTKKIGCAAGVERELPATQ
jgi:hypothetical protein